MKIGYIGLGALGSALARRFLPMHELCVWDVNPDAVAEFEKLGAMSAKSAAELARHCEVVLLCLPRSSDVRQVILGHGGLAEGLSAGQLVIDQTSGIPSETRDIAQQLAQGGARCSMPRFPQALKSPLKAERRCWPPDPTTSTNGRFPYCA